MPKAGLTTSTPRSIVKQSHRGFFLCTSPIRFNRGYLPLLTRRCPVNEYPFHARFIQLRREHHLTQKQIGEALGLSPVTISGWELSRSQPDAQTLPLLANLFGISIENLLGLGDAPVALITPRAAFIPVFGSLQFLQGKLTCLDYQGTYPLPIELQERAGKGGILIIPAPDTAFQEAHIQPGARVALFVDLPFEDGELCGVLLGTTDFHLLHVSRIPGGYNLSSADPNTPALSLTGPDANMVHVIGPYAASWHTAPRFTSATPPEI